MIVRDLSSVHPSLSADAIEALVEIARMPVGGWTPLRNNMVVDELANAGHVIVGLMPRRDTVFGVALTRVGRDLAALAQGRQQP